MEQPEREPEGTVQAVPLESDDAPPVEPERIKPKRKAKSPAYARLAKEYGITFGYFKGQPCLHAPNGVPENVLGRVWEGYLKDA